MEEQEPAFVEHHGLRPVPAAARAGRPARLRHGPGHAVRVRAATDARRAGGLPRRRRPARPRPAAAGRLMAGAAGARPSLGVALGEPAHAGGVASTGGRGGRSARAARSRPSVRRAPVRRPAPPLSDVGPSRLRHAAAVGRRRPGAYVPAWAWPVDRGRRRPGWRAARRGAAPAAARRGGDQVVANRGHDGRVPLQRPHRARHRSSRPAGSTPRPGQVARPSRSAVPGVGQRRGRCSAALRPAVPSARPGTVRTRSRSTAGPSSCRWSTAPSAERPVDPDAHRYLLAAATRFQYGLRCSSRLPSGQAGALVFGGAADRLDRRRSGAPSGAGAAGRAGCPSTTGPAGAGRPRVQCRAPDRARRGTGTRPARPAARATAASRPAPACRRASRRILAVDPVVPTAARRAVESPRGHGAHGRAGAASAARLGAGDRHDRGLGQAARRPPCSACPTRSAGCRARRSPVADARAGRAGPTCWSASAATARCCAPCG